MRASQPEEVRAAADQTRSAPNEGLTLPLGAWAYGIDILRVQEIRSIERPTRSHLLGIATLEQTESQHAGPD